MNHTLSLRYCISSIWATQSLSITCKFTSLRILKSRFWSYFSRVSVKYSTNLRSRLFARVLKSICSYSAFCFASISNQNSLFKINNKSQTLCHVASAVEIWVFKISWESSMNCCLAVFSHSDFFSSSSFASIILSLVK